MSTTAFSADLVVIYLRVSTEDQAKHGYSLPDQREKCHRKAREVIGHDGFRVVEFEDRAGGDILDRPALEQMRDFVQDNRPGYFVCMDPDRFSRKLSIQLLVTEELEKAGTRLVFVNHDYQSTEEGQLFYSIRGAVSEYEKAKILQRTKAGARRKVKQGQVATGTRPYGYTYDKLADTLAVVPTEAKWVVTIFEWAAAKVAPMEIADRLNAMGVPTRYGRPWRSSTIQNMLRNTTYIGQMICFRWNTAGYTAQRQLPKARRKFTPKQRPKDEWVTVAVPAIVAEPLFAAVQQSRKTHKRTARKTAGLLSGIARCGLCGAAIHYIADRSMGHVLRCHARYPRRDALVKAPRCTLPNVRASIIEDTVWAELTEWVINPDGIDEKLHRNQDVAVSQAEIARLTPVLEGYRKQLAEKRNAQMVTVQHQSAGILDVEVAAKLLAEAKAHIDVLQKQIRETELVIEALGRTTTLNDGFVERMKAMHKAVGKDLAKAHYIMEHMDPRKRQAFIRMVGVEVLLYPGRHSVITLPDQLSEHIGSATCFDNVLGLIPLDVPVS